MRKEPSTYRRAYDTYKFSAYLHKFYKRKYDYRVSIQDIRTFVDTFTNTLMKLLREEDINVPEFGIMRRFGGKRMRFLRIRFQKKIEKIFDRYYKNEKKQKRNRQSPPLVS